MVVVLLIVGLIVVLVFWHRYGEQRKINNALTVTSLEQKNKDKNLALAEVKLSTVSPEKKDLPELGNKSHANNPPAQDTVRKPV